MDSKNPVRFTVTVSRAGANQCTTMNAFTRKDCADLIRSCRNEHNEVVISVHEILFSGKKEVRFYSPKNAVKFA
jgi:hypothetical protein